MSTTARCLKLSHPVHIVSTGRSREGRQSEDNLGKDTSTTSDIGAMIATNRLQSIRGLD
ncbi:hypothetical protein CERZMDRAFT_90776 [Cercospora zeae-maydis SCOH1-5]|uniref:Uncharacterized protein n=1 Tax=Cercospora zeae-maydis SCOH1-5 TaxID=717836 RepID=A0A6A6FEJ1_9PEZI|nr:hypothetical protein CERZMDRAFT_90776 [Cercospora zeae-maydis SCOH1-5]